MLGSNYEAMTMQRVFRPVLAEAAISPRYWRAMASIYFILGLRRFENFHNAGLLRYIFLFTTVQSLECYGELQQARSSACSFFASVRTRK